MSTTKARGRLTDLIRPAKSKDQNAAMRERMAAIYDAQAGTCRECGIETPFGDPFCYRHNPHR